VIRPTGFGGQELRSSSNRRLMAERAKQKALAAATVEASAIGYSSGYEDGANSFESFPILRLPDGAVLLGLQPDERVLVSVRVPSHASRVPVEYTVCFKRVEQCFNAHGTRFRWFTFQPV